MFRFSLRDCQDGHIENRPQKNLQDRKKIEKLPKKYLQTS
uniref:Uncharacterized protein n=1 Tax=Myoviridae sp. ctCjb12 TaxID=2826631 RepID=A0A8S5MQC4_9CAUD|nr:MAG TPA: hypothetical protein [Myoviridae sp. ctCjb12]